jgi:hypothetical protein
MGNPSLWGEAAAQARRVRGCASPGEGAYFALPWLATAFMAAAMATWSPR